MARAARFVRSATAHLVVQRGHNRQRIVIDDTDRHVWREALVRSVAEHEVRLNAWALCDDHFLLMVTPREASALGRLMQDVGRSYVAAFNRRHARSGTLWDGRFRACVLQSGACELDALRYVESSCTSGLDSSQPTAGYRWSSRGHHLGQAADPLITDPAAYWALGNTPFEREAAYRSWIDQPLGFARVAELEGCLRQGRPWGDAGFVRQLELEVGRSLSAQPRGRPRKRS